MKTCKVLVGLAFSLTLALICGRAVASEPGQLLLKYPEEAIWQQTKIHPDRARQANAQDNILNQRLGLEGASQRVADEILQAEAGHAPLCATNDARYFQIKAVYELRQSELHHANRDLLRAQDALRQSCAAPPVVLASAAPRELAETHVRHHRRVRHRRHCKCV